MYALTRICLKYVVEGGKSPSLFSFRLFKQISTKILKLLVKTPYSICPRTYLSKYFHNPVTKLKQKNFPLNLNFVNLIKIVDSINLDSFFRSLLNCMIFILHFENFRTKSKNSSDPRTLTKQALEAKVQS